MTQDLARSIGAGMREGRLALKLTQEDAAERVGISAEFYARMERGRALPSMQTLVSICAALGVSADRLLGGDGTAATGGAFPAPEPPSDPPELRRLFRRLRGARPATLRAVTAVLAAVEERPE